MSRGGEARTVWPTMMVDTPGRFSSENARVLMPTHRRTRPGIRHAQGWTEGRIRGHGRSGRHRLSCLDMMIEYSKIANLRPAAVRAPSDPIHDRDSAMERHSCRLMVSECAWRHDRGEDVRSLIHDEDHVRRNGERVVDRSTRCMGGLGLMARVALRWWYRQVRSIRITEGTPEVLRWRLASTY